MQDLSHKLLKLCGNNKVAAQLLVQIAQLHEDEIKELEADFDQEREEALNKARERDRAMSAAFVTRNQELKIELEKANARLAAYDELGNKSDESLKKCAAKLVTALEKGNLAASQQKKYFSAVAGKELINALIMKVTKCGEKDVWMRLENPSAKDMDEMAREHSLNYEQLRSIDKWFREERNLVCHEARIWAWMFGGEPWIQDLFKRAKIKYNETMSANMTKFLKIQFARAHCSTCNLDVEVQAECTLLRCSKPHCGATIVSRYDFELIQAALDEAKSSCNLPQTQPEAHPRASLSLA